MALKLDKLWNVFRTSNNTGETEGFYTYSFGTLGRTLDTARAGEFFSWFHLAETERQQQPPGELIRFRPSGPKFHELCHLDVLTGPTGDMAQMELYLRRSFLNGRDSLFAQDLVKSFLSSALPEACRHSLPDFIREITSLGGSGVTEGFRVFRGQQSSWQTQTGWSRLHLLNTGEGPGADLVVRVSPNPSAPNASRLETKAENA